jgi:UDP-2,3-diacylglucosamine pyrophosphatase LpxH
MQQQGHGIVGSAARSSDVNANESRRKDRPMTNKIVAISDVHLGQPDPIGAEKAGEYSLLSTRVTGNYVQKFADAVRAFADGDKVTLLVAGDFLDLSLAYVEDALCDMRELLKAVKVDEIVYLIGNHDIQMWSLHCEEKNLLSVLRAGKIPSNDPRDPNSKALYKVTSNAGEPFTLLQPLVDEIYGAGKVPITIAYPSYTRQLPDGSLLYSMHGHLIGGIYTKLSELLQSKLAGLPRDRVAATVNQPLIGLIYWLLGEMGEGLGADGLLQEIYTDLEKGDNSRIKEIVDRFVALLLPDGIIGGVPDSWERAAVASLIMSKIGNVLPQAASPGACKDRHADVTKTLDELLNWILSVSPVKESVADTTHVTHIISGHTHDRWCHEYPGKRTISWNLSTWLVEPKHALPQTGFLGIDTKGVASWIDVR